MLAQDEQNKVLEIMEAFAPYAQGGAAPVVILDNLFKTGGFRKFSPAERKDIFAKMKGVAEYAKRHGGVAFECFLFLSNAKWFLGRTPEDRMEITARVSEFIQKISQYRHTAPCNGLR